MTGTVGQGCACGRTAPAFRGFARALLLALALLLAPATARAQDCVLPPDLVALNALLADLADRGAGSIDPASRQRLRTLVLAMPEQRTIDILAQRKLDALGPVTLDLLTAAARIAETGQLTRPLRLTAMLSHTSARLEAACLSHFDSWFRGRQSGTPMDVPGSENGSGETLPAPDTAAEVATRVGGLTAALLAMIALIYGVDAGYRWLFTLMFNRRACRINARVEAPRVSFAGAVTTLGRGGFQFEPDDPAEFRSVAGLLDGVPLILSIGDARFDARASGFSQADFKARFDRKLQIATQRKLLARSTVTPVFVRRARGQRKRAAPTS